MGFTFVQPNLQRYDFGDWGEFEVTLERVDPAMAIKGPVVLEAYGEPPDQHPAWDGEGW